MTISRMPFVIKDKSSLDDITSSSNFELLKKRNQDTYDFISDCDFVNDAYLKMTEEYTYNVHHANDIETIELTKKKVTENYEIYFAGADQDATAQHSLVYRTQNLSEHSGFADKERNFIFWNYPGVGANESCNLSLCEAGYKQVKYLIDTKKITAEKIILHGKSLGGAVAIQVAELLYKEGFYVNLEIDRSFSKLSSAAAKMIEPDLRIYKLQVLINSILVFSMWGALLGILIAGWIARLECTPAMILGSLLGGIIAAVGALLTALLGCICGIILSLQYLWTCEPITCQLEPACRYVLSALSWEMDSVSKLKDIEKSLNVHTPPKIEIINTKKDSIIPLDVSLIAGLELLKIAAFSLSKYNYGGHILAVSQEEIYYQGKYKFKS